MSQKLILIIDQYTDCSNQLTALVENLGYQTCQCQLDSPVLDHLALPYLILLGGDNGDPTWELDKARLSDRFPCIPVVATGVRRFGRSFAERLGNLMAIIDHNLDDNVMALFGPSGSMQSLRAAIDNLASSDLPVLITGEAGSGKLQVARQIHALSRRAQEPFVSVNCKTIPSTLLEEELFGLHIGARNASCSRRRGQFDRANGGSLFLSEIEAITPAVQLKLMQLLEHRTIRRFDGVLGVPVDVRLLAASPSELAPAVRAGTFRKDLALRLNGFPLRVPALRERPDDIPCLAYVLGQELEQKGWPGFSMSDDCIARLKQYKWPGNVGELANLIEHLSVFYPDRSIDVDSLPSCILAASEQAQPPRDFRMNVLRTRAVAG